MIRIILGVIVGFIAWSILWIGSDQVLRSASPSWYGAEQTALEKALFNNTEFAANTLILLFQLVRSFIISILSGFLCAFVATENRRSTVILGILLLVFGLFVQIGIWNHLPVWYHIIFLGALTPMTVIGGRIKRDS